MLASAWLASVLVVSIHALRDSSQQGVGTQGSSAAIVRSHGSQNVSEESVSVDLFAHTASSREDAQVGVGASGGASEEVVPEELRLSVKQGVDKAVVFAEKAAQASQQEKETVFAAMSKSHANKELPSDDIMHKFQEAMKVDKAADSVKALASTHIEIVDDFFNAVEGFTEVRAGLVAEHKKKLAAQREAHVEEQRQAEEFERLKREEKTKSTEALIQSLETALSESQARLTEKISERREDLLNFERLQTIQEVKLVGDLLDFYGKVHKSQREIKEIKETSEQQNITGTGAAEVHALVSTSTVGITNWGNTEVRGVCEKYLDKKFQELFPPAEGILRDVRAKAGTTQANICRRFVRSFLEHIKSTD
jgi:hypothetical protein